MKAGKINAVHPELRNGEVFLSNASDRRMPFSLGDFTDNRSSWESIGWQTKRRGVVAYDVSGNPIKSMFPVFVMREELIKGGINPDKL